MEFDTSPSVCAQVAERVGFIFALNLFFFIFSFVFARPYLLSFSLSFIFAWMSVNLFFLVFLVAKKTRPRDNVTPFFAFRQGMENFGKGVSTLITFVLLFFVYFFGVGFTSLVAKLFKKHFLDLEQGKRGSYYIVKQLKKEHIDQYYRQF